jgi:hypothetical protein
MRVVYNLSVSCSDDLNETSTNDSSNNWDEVNIGEVKLPPLYIDEIPENTVPTIRYIGYTYIDNDPYNHAVQRFRVKKVAVLGIYVNRVLVAKNVFMASFTCDPDWNYKNCPIYRTNKGLQCGDFVVVPCETTDQLDLVNICIEK